MQHNQKLVTSALRCATLRANGYPNGSANGVAHKLKVPKVASVTRQLASKCRRTFQNAHTYHINSISVNSDQETFLSADDLRINLWHLDVVDQSFNIVDIKPSQMEDLTEVFVWCCRVFHQLDLSAALTGTRMHAQ